MSPRQQRRQELDADPLLRKQQQMLDVAVAALLAGKGFAPPAALAAEGAGDDSAAGGGAAGGGGDRGGRPRASTAPATSGCEWGGAQALASQKDDDEQYDPRWGLEE
jgi:hypothetical protein